MADPRLNIRITADLADIKAALGAVSKDLEGFKKKASEGTDRLSGGLRTASAMAYRLGAALGAAFSVRTLAQMSDEAGEINARLKLATKSAEEFNRAQRATYDIAQRTRTSYKATAELYARIERSTRDIGLNQATMLALTETINKAAQLSGGGQGAEAALFQLSQGLASGTLRGEELNSILEQTPRLAQAIAEGLDMPIGKLRQYAQEGKLTAGAVTTALLKSRDDIAAEFAQLPPSISGGFTQIRNAFLQYLTTSTEAQTAARKVAEALKLLADNMPAIIDAFIRLATVVAAYVVLFKALPALYAAVIAMTQALATQQLSLAAAFTAAGTAGQRAMFAVRSAAGLLIAAFAGWQLGSYLREQFLEVELFGIAMVSGLMSGFERLKGAARIAGAFIKNAFTEPLATIRAAFEANLAGMADALEAVGADKLASAARKAAAAVRPVQSAYRDAALAIGDETAAAVARIQGEFESLADAAIATHGKADAAAAAVGEITTPTGGGGVASKFRADLELLRDSIDRALAELERLYEDGEVGLREYFQRKQALQLEAIDTSIALARQELAVAEGQDAQAKALVQIEKLQRDRAEVGPRVAREQAKAEEALARSLEDVRDRIAELQGDTAASARRAIEREREELLKKFADDPQAASLVDQLFNVETARANLSAIRDQVQQTIGDLRGTEELLAAQQEAGHVAPAEAERQLQEIRARSMQQLQQYREQLSALYATSGDPEVLRQLQAVDTEIARVAANMSQLRRDFTGQAISSLTTFFTDLASGTKSAGDALRDFVLDFARGMAQIAAKALATYAVLALLDAVYPGLGKATAATMSAGVAHSGAVVGRGFPARRQVDPAIFAAAPRLHSGGVVGLRPGEVPAILQTGEEVLSRGDPRNVTNGGGRTGPGTGTRVINVLDPSLVQDYLDTPDGEEAVLNIIGRNPGRVKQAVS